MQSDYGESKINICIKETKTFGSVFDNLFQISTDISCSYAFMICSFKTRKIIILSKSCRSLFWVVLAGFGWFSSLV